MQSYVADFRHRLGNGYKTLIDVAGELALSPGRVQRMLRHLRCHSALEGITAASKVRYKAATEGGTFKVRIPRTLEAPF